MNLSIGILMSVGFFVIYFATFGNKILSPGKLYQTTFTVHEETLIVVSNYRRHYLLHTHTRVHTLSTYISLEIIIVKGYYCKNVP